MIVQYGSTPIEIDIEGTQSIFKLVKLLEEKTGVPEENMKLISRGRLLYPRNVKDRHLPEVLLISDLPFGTRSKILMVGNATYEEPPKEIPRIKDDLTEEGRNRRGKYVLDAHDLNNKGLQIKTNYRFHAIQTLPNLPEEHKAREILSTLASDPGILSVLSKHKWSVGALCELYPEGYVGVSDVCVMGLNENHGQRILLRLRTDDLKGFRKILSIRKVLYHELAHNVHSDHDDNFYMLMRQIENESKELDWRNSRGSTTGVKRHLSSTPFSSPLANATGHIPQQTHILGGAEDTQEASGSRPPAPLMAGVAAISRFASTAPHTHSPSVASPKEEVEQEEQEEDVCCGCSREFSEQKYMSSEEVESTHSLFDQMTCAQDEILSNMEESGRVVEVVDEQGSPPSVSIDRNDARDVDWSSLIMAAVDAKVADAYVYLLDTVEDGRAAPNGELEEKLPALREAIHNLCAASSDSVSTLRDAMALLKDIISRAMLVFAV